MLAIVKVKGEKYLRVIKSITDVKACTLTSVMWFREPTEEEYVTLKQQEVNCEKLYCESSYQLHRIYWL